MPIVHDLSPSSVKATLAAAEVRLAEFGVQPTAAGPGGLPASLSTAQDTCLTSQPSPAADDLLELRWSVERARSRLRSSQMSRDAVAQRKSNGQNQVGVFNAVIAVAQAKMALRNAQDTATAVALAQVRSAVLKAQETLPTVQAGANDAAAINRRPAAGSASRTHP